MAADTLFRRITDYANRTDPYPLYAELRENGVARQDDGSYLVGTYHDIAALLHDPRISSDRRSRTVPDDLEAPGMPSASAPPWPPGSPWGCIWANSQINAGATPPTTCSLRSSTTPAPTAVSRVP